MLKDEDLNPHDPKSLPWEVGGPYPGTSVIIMIDPGSGWPNPEPPTYEAITILDQRIEGEQCQGALKDARFIVRACNSFHALLKSVERLAVYTGMDEADEEGAEAEGETYAEIWREVKGATAKARKVIE